MAKQILTVDDSSSIRQMVAFTLKSAGYEVSEASTGNEAMLKIKGKKFDLILTDQNMPGMDGITLLKNIKSMFHNDLIFKVIVSAEY